MQCNAVPSIVHLKSQIPFVQHDPPVSPDLSVILLREHDNRTSRSIMSRYQHTYSHDRPFLILLIDPGIMMIV
jgi:hypothetical protein